MRSGTVRRLKSARGCTGSVSAAQRVITPSRGVVLRAIVAGNDREEESVSGEQL
jgi:hypothetical protein